MIQKRLKILELTREIVFAGFSEMKKQGKLQGYEGVFHGKNTPDFLLKYFERYEEKLRRKLIYEEVALRTGLTSKKIKFKLANGYTMKEILSLYEKNI